jgi:hypothetical protein
VRRLVEGVFKRRKVDGSREVRNAPDRCCCSSELNVCLRHLIEEQLGVVANEWGPSRMRDGDAVGCAA